MTVKQYLARLRRFAVRVATKHGCDLAGSSRELRAIAMALLCVMAVVVKVLADKGVVTNAEWAAAFDAAEEDAYDVEPKVAPRNGQS